MQLSPLSLISLIALAITPFAPAVRGTPAPAPDSYRSNYGSGYNSGYGYDYSPKHGYDSGSKHGYDWGSKDSSNSGYNYNSDSKNSGSYNSGYKSNTGSYNFPWTGNEYVAAAAAAYNPAPDYGSSYNPSYGSGYNPNSGSYNPSSGSKNKDSGYDKSNYGSGWNTVTIRYDETYDNSWGSMNSVACSDGQYGLYSKWHTFGDVPSFPYVGATSAIAGWNSEKCGSCWEINWGGKSIYIVALDHAEDGWTLSKHAMDYLTENQAEKYGQISNVKAMEVDSSKCSSANYY